MKISAKFKLLSKLNRVSYKVPLRVLKFKRPKWSRIQKNLISSSQRPHLLLNVETIKNTLKKWDKIRGYYKKKVSAKLLVSHIYNNSVNVNSLYKKAYSLKSRTDLIRHYLIAPLFRVDLVLYNLNFFASSAQACQFINSRAVLVNGCTINRNRYLKRGDLVTFDNNYVFSKDLPVYFNKHALNTAALPFVEFDIYTQSLIIVKNVEDLSTEDFFLICNEYLNIKTFY